MKRVNPKSIKISDEIEKRPKWGLLSIFQFAEGPIHGKNEKVIINKIMINSMRFKILLVV